MKFLTFFGLVIITQIFLSCQKNTDSDILGKWQVMKVKIAEKVHDFKALDYQLNFENDSLISLKLDVNTCGATYKLKNEEVIEIHSNGCTYMCCDHDLSFILVPEFYKAKSVEIDGDDMELKGENTIYLKKL